MSSQSAALVKSDKAFFGHPHGLMTLFGTELWERFSYYGMRAILLYFLIENTTNGGLGLEKGVGESLVQIYNASAFLLAIVGGWVADRLWGPRRSTLYGGLVIMSGHICLAIPAATFSYLGIALVALGTGLLKPNVTTMVGSLYRDDDPRRDGGFSIFYMGINIGSLAAPFAVQAAKSWGGYHAGFSVAAFGMAIALIFFAFGRKYLSNSVDDVPNPLNDEERKIFLRNFLIGLIALTALLIVIRYTVSDSYVVAVINTASLLGMVVPIVYFTMMFKSKRVTSAERSRLTAFIPLFIAAGMFWMIFEQAASSMATFAKFNTELNAFGVTLAPEWFQSINPAGIVVLAPLFAMMWSHLGANRPPTAYKFVIGLALASASFIWLGSWAMAYEGLKAPWWVLTITFIIQTVGELCLSPVGLAATTLLAPRAFKSQAMALWLMASSAGQAITAQILKATGDVSPAYMFLGVGGAAAIFTLILLGLSPWITRHIDTRDEEADAAEAARLEKLNYNPNE